MSKWHYAKQSNCSYDEEIRVSNASSLESTAVAPQQQLVSDSSDDAEIQSFSGEEEEQPQSAVQTKQENALRTQYEENDAKIIQISSNNKQENVNRVDNQEEKQINKENSNRQNIEKKGLLPPTNSLDDIDIGENTNRSSSASQLPIQEVQQIKQPDKEEFLLSSQSSHASKKSQMNASDKLRQPPSSPSGVDQNLQKSGIFSSNSVQNSQQSKSLSDGPQSVKRIPQQQKLDNNSNINVIESNNPDRNIAVNKRSTNLSFSKSGNLTERDLLASTCDLDDSLINFDAMSEEQLQMMFGNFQPVELTLETLFTPFLQEYQPAVSEVDPFIKIAPPDLKIEKLGLYYADEPTINQSNEVVLKAKLQQIYGEIRERNQIAPIAHSKEQIDKFIIDMQKTHKDVEYDPKPRSFYFEYELYSEKMCNILNDLFGNFAKIDLETEQFLRLCCALMDIEFDAEDPISSCFKVFQVYFDIEQMQILGQK